MLVTEFGDEFVEGKSAILFDEKSESDFKLIVKKRKKINVRY